MTIDITNPNIVGRTVHSYFLKNGKKQLIQRSDIPHILLINKETEILSSQLDWCKENCKSPWGWYFEWHRGSFIGFADPNEKTLFCLTNNYC